MDPILAIASLVERLHTVARSGLCSLTDWKLPRPPVTMRSELALSAEPVAISLSENPQQVAHQQDDQHRA